MGYFRTVSIMIVAVLAMASSAPAMALDVVGSGFSGKVVGGLAERYWLEWTAQLPEVEIGSEGKAADAFCSGTGARTPVLLALDRRLTAGEAATCRDNGIDAAVLLTLGRIGEGETWRPVNVYVKSGHPRVDDLGGFFDFITSEFTIGDRGSFRRGDLRRFGFRPLEQAEREALRAMAAELEAVPIAELAGATSTAPPPGPDGPDGAERTALVIMGVAVGMTAPQAEAAPQAYGFTFKGRSSKPPWMSHFERPHTSGVPETLTVNYEKAANGALRVVAVSRGVRLPRSARARGQALDVAAFEHEVRERYDDPYGCAGLNAPSFRCAYADSSTAPRTLLIAQGYKDGISLSLFEYDQRRHGTLLGTYAE